MWRAITSARLGVKSDSPRALWNFTANSAQFILPKLSPAASMIDPESSLASGQAGSRPLILRVYYEDTDFSGRVYHASYLRFLERGRTEWLRAQGFAQRELAAEEGLVFAVRRIEIDYLKPALMDDLLTIETSLVAVGGASIEFRQLALRGEEAMAKALVGVVALSNGRPARLPRDMRARLSAPKL
jgi:acyl-CoA thioester hydrolase